VPCLKALCGGQIFVAEVAEVAELQRRREACHTRILPRDDH
jgi:hypothetical protein